MRQLITQLSNHACAVRRASNQSISNATTTDINFLAGATVEVDTDKMFDTSSSAKLTVKRNGLWLVGAHVLWENNGTGRRDLHLSVDGTVVVSERVDLGDGEGALMVARRGSDDGVIRWSVVFDAGLDPSDPALRQAADAALTRLRDSLGI